MAAETGAGVVVGRIAPTGQIVVQRILVEVMTISDVKEAGQCRTVEEHDVMVIMSVDMTVEVVNDGVEVIVAFEQVEVEEGVAQLVEITEPEVKEVDDVVVTVEEDVGSAVVEVVMCGRVRQRLGNGQSTSVVTTLGLAPRAFQSISTTAWAQAPTLMSMLSVM